MEVRTLIELFGRWWVVLLIVAVLSGVLGYAAGERVPLAYSSTSRALVGPVDASFESIRAARDNLETYAALLTSEPVLQEVIDRIGLDATPELLRLQLDIRTDFATRIVTIRAVDQEPDRAANLANALVDQLSFLPVGAEPEGQIQVIDRGPTPSVPDSPGTIQTAGVAMFGGILGTLLAIVALDVAGSRVRGRHDLEERVPAPFLAHAALVSDPSTNRKHPVSPAAILARAVESRTPKPRSLVVPANDQDDWDPAFQLAVALARSARESQAVALLLIGDGAGYSRDELASVSAVLAGRRRNGPARPGSVQIFAGPELGRVNNLPNSNGGLADLLDEQFELAIIHVPPLHLSAEAVAWAGVAEGAIVSATSGKTRRERLQYTVETLTQIHTPILGSVLVDSRSLRRRPSALMDNGIFSVGSLAARPMRGTSSPALRSDDVAGL